MNDERMIRVFARRTKMTPADELAFFDEPPLFDLPDLPVAVSVTFTWDIPRGFRLYEAWRRRVKHVEIGGPAFPDTCWGSRDFHAGRFLRPGVTITSRGCPYHCRWCLVPSHERSLESLARIESGHIVQDNNLLACHRNHIERVFEMLTAQREPAVFAGGLHASLLQSWHIDWFKRRDFRLDEAWFACDTPTALGRLDRVADLMSDFRLRQKRCYVLAGFEPEDTPTAAERRCEAVLRKGFCPFLMLYQPECRRTYSPEWRAAQRKWDRPAAYLKKKASVAGQLDKS